MDKVQILFSKYQEKYPLHRTEVIIDKMLDDGVITFEDAKNLREGKSIFSINNYFTSINDDMTITEIMGGHFSTKTTPKTNFNRKIEPTNQPWTQGDCWLLSDINALNTTEWGRKAIEEAIIPDTDGTGGVTIKFIGSPLEQKEIYITAEEIVNARESGNYVAEDDDMIAFELATEKTFREMVKLGLAERVDDDASMEKLGIKYRSYISGGVKTEEFQQFPISNLLGFETYELEYHYYEERLNSEKEKEELFKWINKNIKNISMTCSFNFIFGGYGDENSKDYIHGGHAYTIKKIEYQKGVILSDPHYSEYKIRVPWKVFIDSIRNINLSFNKQEIKQYFSSILPEGFINFIEDVKNYYKNIDQTRDERIRNLIKRADELNLSGIEREKFFEENSYIKSYREYLSSK